MKKILGILIGLLMITNVFGQILLRDYSDIERYGYVERCIHVFKDNLGDYSWIKSVHFIKNGYLYVFAYEPLEDRLMEGERKLYLYRKNISNIDNPWIVSSDVIITNYIKNGGGDYRDVRLTTKNFPFGDADIIEKNNEYIVTIGIHVFKNYRLFTTGTLTFTLTPINDGCYAIKRGSKIYKRKSL